MQYILSVIDNNRILVEDESPQIALLRSVYPGTIRLQSENYNNIQSIVDEALKQLTPREQEIIDLTYGLNGKSVMSKEEISKSLNLTQNRISQVHIKGLRKIRCYQNRTKQLGEFAEFQNNSYWRFGNRINSILNDEINAAICNRSNDVFWLNKIMKRNGITLKNGFSNEEERYYSSLPVNTANMSNEAKDWIREHEIENIYELYHELRIIKTDEDELFDEIRKHGIVPNERTVTLTIRNKKTIYKYQDNDQDLGSVVQAIRNQISLFGNAATILNRGINEELLYLLLLKGYYYFFDVMNNVEHLSSEAELLGLNDSLEQLKQLIKYKHSNINQIALVSISEKDADQIQKSRASIIDDLKTVNFEDKTVQYYLDGFT